MSNLFCLLTPEKDSVPLKSIDALLEVKDHVATLVSTLNFENKEDKPLETVFVFPLPGDAAVCHFSAQIGETHIVAEVMNRQQARQVYDDALSSGQKVFVLEESDESPDIFSLKVGSLPPGESASIRLEYVTELAVQADDGLRFCLPAVLNPRYQPRGSEGPSVQVTSVPASLVPYSLSFSARVSSPHPISKIESSCPLEPLQYLNADQTQATVKLATGHKFDRDVELLIYYKDAHRPSAVVEAGQVSAKPGTLMGDPAVMVSLYPEFPESVTSNFTSCGEFVFLLDRSGSMDFPTYCGSRQSRIASAKDTLMLLLKSLPMGCYFNIYGLGDSYEQVFPKSAKYNQKNLKRAVKKVEEMGADLGGSEILEPLRQIYRQPCIPKHPRQLFIFTDGEVNYTKAVLDEVKEHSEFHRCFSFGIGEGASSELINGMAREGGGHAQFIVGKERMQPKVMQSLRFALQPLVTDISLSWDLPEGVSVTTLSLPLTALFQGQRSLIFAQLTGECSEAADGCLTVRFTTAGHPCQNQLHFSLQPACDLDFDQKEDMPFARSSIHRLAARTLIRSLEQEQREHGKPEEIEKVVDLSVQSGVSSIFTAFIAVNKSNGEPVQGPLIYRENPTYMPLLRGGLIDLMFDDSWGEKNIFRRICSSIRKRTSASKFGKACKNNLFSASSFKKNQSESIENRGDCEPTEPARDPLLELVSLQDASGCWLLDPCLAAALGKSIEELVKTRPSSAKRKVWGTILALIWLHGHQKDVKVEWELLAMKAASWLRAEKAVGVTVCVEAGNVLLGCNVTTDALGL
ncbi:von Willebrand factor A domain-containing protein 5A-like isoform X1 [Poecilia formosa]|uniref:von Willebrand factor A domain-containing protein 5A-like n=3 Tax=Poecilia formosa TaxID=48698 RepID=A0A087XS08_POEFO|nr:PREDICTED: von Willebrand factor A domain-containing protein 5A-like isoform X1 [Poecilia formosa]XP_016534468.1 PREDICTED: von Willebrand factor A domain-containing protein 5A-like isoform X1 [Poecilia formosa]